MSLIGNIIWSINRRIDKIRSVLIARNHGDETRYHITGERISIGEFSYGIPDVMHYTCDGALTIGKYCSIAKDVKILLGGAHDINCASSYPFKIHKDIFPNAPDEEVHNNTVTIGNDVWIGRGAIILSGVTIGDGAVIGAGAVVSKDIPPYAVAVGSPIRIIRYRLSPGQIQQMLEIKWWDLPTDTINQLLPHMYNVDNFISLCFNKIGGGILLASA